MSKQYFLNQSVEHTIRGYNCRVVQNDFSDNGLFIEGNINPFLEDDIGFEIKIEDENPYRELLENCAETMPQDLELKLSRRMSLLDIKIL